MTHFVKIHAPFDELCDIAEDMKMKMPIQENDVVIKTWLQKTLPSLDQLIKRSDPFVVRDSTVKEEPNFFVATFDKARLKEYIGSSNRDEFFSPAERSRFVYRFMQINSSITNEPKMHFLRLFFRLWERFLLPVIPSE